MNASQRFYTWLIGHDIDLRRLDAGETERVSVILSELNSSIEEAIRETAGDLKSREKIRALIRKSDDLTFEAYAQIAETNSEFLKKLAVVEYKLVLGQINHSVGFPIKTEDFEEETLEALAHAPLTVNGLGTGTAPQWWRAQRDDTILRLRGAIRTAPVMEWDSNRLIEAITGTEELKFRNGLFLEKKRQAGALVASLITSISNQASLRAYAA